MSSAVASAPAPAEAKKCEVESPTHWVFCYSNKEEIGNPVQKVSGMGGVSILVGTIGVEVKFECKENDFAAELELTGKAKGTTTLLKCKETKPAHCKLVAAEEKEIKIRLTESLIGKLEKPGKPEAEFTGAGIGEELFSVEHEIVAKKSGSKLKIGSNEATLSSAAKVKLLSPHEGLGWYFGLGI
jgi:hypothetical protein